MTCQVARQFIQDSLDGSLPQAEREALSQHLAGCAACAQEHASLSKTIEDLAALPRLAAPPELLRRLGPELDALSRRPARKPALGAWIPGGAIAAGLLIALGLFQLLPALDPFPQQVAMDFPSSEEILQWVDASADPMDVFAFYGE